MRFKKGHKPVLTSRRYNYKQAVWDKCKECIYDPEFKGGGYWKQQVTDCSSLTCPLYPVRPKVKKRREINDGT
jgi:hypothetical protein|tara:strand:+ start:241 stop:459 length:219 start_codon:yes stop_codon:yes gene_type:complete